MYYFCHIFPGLNTVFTHIFEYLYFTLLDRHVSFVIVSAYYAIYLNLLIIIENVKVIIPLCHCSSWSYPPTLPVWQDVFKKLAADLQRL